MGGDTTTLDEAITTTQLFILNNFNGLFLFFMYAGVAGLAFVSAKFTQLWTKSCAGGKSCCGEFFTFAATFTGFFWALIGVVVPFVLLDKLKWVNTPAERLYPFIALNLVGLFSFYFVAMTYWRYGKVVLQNADKPAAIEIEAVDN